MKKRTDNPPEEGEHEKCRYCEKMRPKSELIKRKISYRGTGDYGEVVLKSHESFYCGDSGCAGYAQMACEG